jgi:hypothetical protein
LILRIVRLAEQKNNLSVILGLLGYPTDLPNLKRKRPPGRNTRPAGIDDSSYEVRQRGRLPLIY